MLGAPAGLAKPNRFVMVLIKVLALIPSSLLPIFPPKTFFSVAANIVRTASIATALIILFSKYTHVSSFR